MKDKRTTFRYFSRGERRVFLSLLFISCACFVLPSALLDQPEQSEVAEADRVWLEKQHAEWKKNLKKKRTSFELAGKAEVSRVALRRFDPNHAGEQEWGALGISPRLAGNWKKYLERGGRFRTVGDVNKLYGMEPAIFEKIKPWMFVASAPRDSFPGLQNRAYKNNRACATMDVNAADSAAWEKLPGIGPVLAGRIVRFRNRLGGFYSIEQVGETYGLPDSTFQRIYPCLGMDTPPALLEINTASEAELRIHPYLGFRLARMLVAFRTQHGPFSIPEDLFKLPLMDTITYQRLKPYLRH